MLLTDTADTVDRVLREVLGRPEFAGVYAGPWWPLPSADGEVRGWKRAVLKRRSGGGAEHWGHLFLVEAPESRSWKMEESKTPGPSEPAAERASYQWRRDGRNIFLETRPRTAGTSPSLSELVLVLAKELAGKFDGVEE